MANENTPAFGAASFLAMLAAVEKRREIRIEELCGFLQHPPVSPAVLREIEGLGPTDRSAVLRHHPGFKIDKKIQSIWSMLAIFEEAYRSILYQLDCFHEFSSSKEMHLPIGKQKLVAIEVAVRKELVAFSASASALVDFSRRANASIHIPDIAAMVRSIFDMEEHKFVTALRNIICHQELPDVDWQITYGASRSADFIIGYAGLHHLREMPNEARSYVERSREGISVRALACSYAERVKRYYEWYAVALAENLTVEVIEYRRIVAACRAAASRNMYRLFFQQFRAMKVNPYEHLHKYLLPADLEEALKLPMRSREQVDFIIRAVDEHGACDSELRESAYALFDVCD